MKHDKGGHPQDGEFQAIYKIHKEFTLLRIYIFNLFSMFSFYIHSYLVQERTE
mgnify:CR=1 FL=1